MALPDLSIHISANVVAWYAAIVSTIGICLTGYTMWKDRARIRISVTPNMKVMNLPRYDSNKHYIDVTVRNQGRRPLKISTVSLKLYRTKGFMLVSDTLFQNFERVLDEKNPRATFFVEQGILSVSMIDYVLLHDDAGHYHVHYNRPGARVRRFVRRWIRDIDYLDPPSRSVATENA